MASLVGSIDRVCLLNAMNALKCMCISSLAEHPSKWFEKNPGQRPPVELPVALYPLNLDQVRGIIKHFLLNRPSHRLSPDLVLLYFRKLAETMHAKLDRDWQSFGIEIGSAGRAVGPLNIVRVKDSAAIELEPNPTAPAGPEDDLWMLMALTAPFYHSVLAVGNVNSFEAPPEVLKTWKDAGFEPGLFWENNYMLANHSSYRIMIAVFDMFLVRFPNHEFYTARRLTIASRFHECGAYASLYRLSDLIKKDFREIRKWLWGSQLQNELLKLTIPGHEMDQRHSYAPYFMALQLAHISAYSENEHPNLYAFCNIVSATLNDREARCARMPVEAVFPDVSLNACSFAYTLIINEFPDKDFGWWFEWFYHYRSRYERLYAPYPQDLINELHHKKWSKFGNDPRGSIGHMLHRGTLPGMLVD